MDSSAPPTVRRRERTRSESGKENSSVTTTTTTTSLAASASSIGPVATVTASGAARQRRSGPLGLRERYSEAALASAVAALSAADTDDHPGPRLVAESPVEFCVTDSALPSDSDHGGPWGDAHSSEEELECINGPEQLVSMMAGSGAGIASSAVIGGPGSSALRFGPSAFGPPGDKIRRGKTPQQVRFPSIHPSIPPASLLLMKILPVPTYNETGYDELRCSKLVPSFIARADGRIFAYWIGSAPFHFFHSGGRAAATTTNSQKKK